MTAITLAFVGIVMCQSFAAQAQESANVSLTPLVKASTWLNGAPSNASLHGKVVLVDVFTFDCINCKNITPNLRSLQRSKRSDGLAILGIHSPETAYEHEHSAVVTNLKSLGVTWPVAIDNDFTLWNAYHIDAWPTQLIFDRRGALRKVVVGDSQDALVNATIDALLKERA
ncbi:MAG: redoxin domain-containing protein [Candidatus Eremiobacteraeota bacterium]|nr:redoxin domain-containing protein [Candidatus Eremiobacteraeota bacterium]MBC5803712.1 redoxin domain-containing protein [Candidatus Eremiobacteraeota bacterium]MBC5820809.1 redoxin domain-containing protein [Candidatus Eremiobacteraeota bacterium]